MAQMMADHDDSFTLERFLDLYGKSLAVQSLSVEEKTRIDAAIEAKDFGLLRKLYLHLKHEEEAIGKINADFLKDREEAIDDFNITATELEKQYFEEPQKEARAKAEEKEREAAEQILKKI
ncbi:MAG TPA: hypothetical protein PKA32_01485 [Candidatus Gracilibacteria bacterium]|nr:hypothetical protein [Candidatus Gracilibacteria bacterium]